MDKQQWQMFKDLGKAELGRGIGAERFVRPYAKTTYAQVENVALTERQSTYLLFLHHRYRRQFDHVCTARCDTIEREMIEAVPTPKEVDGELARRVVSPESPAKERERLEKWNRAASDWRKHSARGALT